MIISPLITSNLIRLLGFGRIPSGGVDTTLCKSVFAKGSSNYGTTNIGNKFKTQATVSTGVSVLDWKGVQSNFCQLLQKSNPRELPDYFNQINQLSNLKNFQHQDAGQFQESLVQLKGSLLDSKDTHNYQTMILALVLIANASQHDGEKPREILALLLKISGPVFETFPDLTTWELMQSFEYRLIARKACEIVSKTSNATLEYYMYVLSVEIDEIWNEELKEKTLQGLFPSAYSKSALLDILVSELVELANSDDLDVFNMYIVRLRILLAYAVRCPNDGNEKDILRVYEVFNTLLSADLTLERRIATKRAQTIFELRFKRYLSTT